MQRYNSYGYPDERPEGIKKGKMLKDVELKEAENRERLSARRVVVCYMGEFSLIFWSVYIFCWLRLNIFLGFADNVIRRVKVILKQYIQTLLLQNILIHPI